MTNSTIENKLYGFFRDPTILNYEFSRSGIEFNSLRDLLLHLIENNIDINEWQIAIFTCISPACGKVTKILNEDEYIQIYRKFCMIK